MDWSVVCTLNVLFISFNIRGKNRKINRALLTLVLVFSPLVITQHFKLRSLILILIGTAWWDSLLNIPTLTATRVNWGSATKWNLLASTSIINKMSEDRWAIFVRSALLIPLDRAWNFTLTGNIIGRYIGARSHRSLWVWVDVVGFQRSVPLVVRAIRVLLRPNLFNTALTLLGNFDDTGGLALGDNVEASPAYSFILGLSGVWSGVGIIGILVHVGSNKIVLKWLMDCKTCRIYVLFKVGSLLVRLDHRSALGAVDVADIEPVALLRHVLLGVSNKHSLIWI